MNPRIDYVKARARVPTPGVRRKRLLEQQAALVALMRSDAFNRENLEQALQLVTETTARLMSIERVSIWRYSESRSALLCVDLYERSLDRHSSGSKLEAGRYPAYFEALATSEAIIADDAYTDPRTCEFADDYLTPLNITAMLDFPVHLHGRLRGVLCHEQVGPPVPWTAEDRLFGIAVANIISLALEQTQRKRAEAALRESEQRLATMLAYAPDAIVLLDLETLHFIEANERAVQLFGLDRASLLEVGPVELSPEYQADGRRSSEAAREKLEEAIAGGAPVFEWLHVNAAGDRIPCEVHLVRMPDSTRRLVRGSINDISVRKRLEDERERLNSRWRLLLESAGPGIYGTDTRGRCIFMNRSGEALIGYTAEEVLGRDMHELIHHTRSDGTPYSSDDCPIFRAFKTGQPCRREGEVLWRRDGSSFPSEYAAYPIVSGGVIEGAVVTFSDISERLRAQDELRELKDAAETANRAKSEFLAAMSHELRTPLHSVLGHAQLLRRQEGLLGGQVKALSVIQQSGEHLLGLIDEILDMAKIEHGTLDIVDDPFDLHRLLETIAAIMRVRAEAKGLAFTTTESAQLPAAVHGDERRLRQVLTNLLDNAIKYTRSGTVALQVAPHEGRIRFVVEDTGIGIEPAHLSEIFNLFHQVRDPSVAVDGTGLGLAISRRLTRLMGGELRVASICGVGSRFWFDLDLPEVDTPAPVAETRAVIGVQGAKRRLLVVDDEDYGRSLLRDLLVPLGFEVHEAADGEAAIEEAVRLRPDAILMDIRMPRLNGLEASRRIRRMAELEGVVIIAISAGAFERDRQHCIESGANDFIAKPFRQEKLLDTLCKHLGLTPIHALDETDAGTATGEPAAIPGTEQLHGLLQMATRGDIKGLLDTVEHLESLDPAYSSFVAQMRTRTAGYQMKELRRWLKSLKDTNECLAR
jgi:PAS domain S-box-containing protein